MNYIHSYNVRGSGIQEDFILWLVDSGTTSFLSNLLRHMFIKIPCHTTLNGVGQAVCDTCAPLILHCISEDALIHDDVINFTWLAERPRARTTILMQDHVAQEFDHDPNSKVHRPVKIPVLQKIGVRFHTESQVMLS
jgi:hypothetical protein